jgi:iron(III) transport system ATP-binding protein
MRIALHNVVKRFKGFTALKGINLEIKDGELFTLLGPSGCGKTTTLRLIAGFYQTDGGDILFDDKIINHLPTAQRNIGIVFQNYALWPHMTVYENIAYGLKLKKMPGTEIKRKVDTSLDKVGLSGLQHRYPGQLSGGQQQRVALARALVLNPDVLLLDEPLSNLDAKVRMKVRAEIRQLQQELKITTVYVTHDQEEALTLSDRIAVMREGRIIQLGDPKSLYERPNNTFTANFIGTNNLLEAHVLKGNGDGKYTVQTAIGSFMGIANQPLSPGQKCTIAVRPENVQINSERQEANSFTGKIHFASYLGNILRYDIMTSAGILFKADIKYPWGCEVMAVGTEVKISFAEFVCLLINDRCTEEHNLTAVGGES